MIREARVIRISLVLTFLISAISISGCEPTPSGDIVTPEEREWLNKHGDGIRIAVEPNYAPFLFIEKGGRVKGIAAEFIEAIEESLNIEFQKSTVESLGEILDMCRRNEIDIVNAVTETPERSEYLLFTAPFIEVPNVIIVTEDRKEALTTDDAVKLRLSLVKGYAVTEFLLKNHAVTSLELVPDDLSALLNVSFRKTDAAIVDLATASYLIGHNGISNLRIAGEVDFPIKLAIGSRKDWPIMNRVLEKALSGISEARREKILRKWISIGPTNFYETREFWTVMAVSAFLILAVFAWNRSLEHQVRFRTIQLQKELAERMQAEENQSKLQEQLNQAHKMEAVGTLAGGIAHDFNNILGVIIGNAELALEMIPENDPTRQSLDEILIAGMRASDMVKHLLRFSRKSDQSLRAIHALPVITESLKLLRSSIPASIEIRSDLSADSDIILADPTQIQQVVINLCTNAAHALEQVGGGILEVSLRGMENCDAASGICANSKKTLELTVRDTGTGIPPEIIGKIFDPYFTTKETGKGSGMGLSIVHGIVTDHGGKISISSEEGRGTTVKVLFPVCEKGDQVEIEISDDEIPKGTERILLVDDDPAVIEISCRILKLLGYSVVASSTPSEALEVFRKRPDDFDAILTDMTMPRMSGLQLSEKIREIRRDVPIIICTGYSSMIDEEKALELGISSFVMKPVAMRDIAATIRRVLDSCGKTNT